MIESLHIKNFALIEELNVNFNTCLNILSGETGSGKSIIIDAIGFLLGDKPNIDFIRTNQEIAIVEGLFCLRNQEVVEFLEKIGLNIDSDKLLLIQRTLNRNNKTTYKINGKAITLGMLKDISKLLVDVHGQHEHQSLLNSSYHIDLLDRFCLEELSDFKISLSEIYKEYKNVLKMIDTLIEDDRDIRSRVDLYSFQIKEISEASLEIGEEEKLLERKKFLSSSERIVKNTNEAITLLSENLSEEFSAIEKISEALECIKELSLFDDDKKSMYENLYNISVELEEIVRDLRNYRETLEHDPYELDKIEYRLSAIYNLKRKYGNNIKEILEYFDDITRKLLMIENKEEELEKLQLKKEILYNQAIILCDKISLVRKYHSEILGTNIKTVLKELGMENAEFKIEIINLEKFSPNGSDKVEFLISPNVGEPLKPLAKIASGGEISRVMLALKTVLADVDSIDTFIFDEIDTGVSGRTAQKVAEKLNLLSKNHQILCITHLPQIASMADGHFLIEKKTQAEKTVTNIYELDKDDSVKELARLIGGAKITEHTLVAAAEMKELAKKIKNY